MKTLTRKQTNPPRNRAHTSCPSVTGGEKEIPSSHSVFTVGNMLQEARIPNDKNVSTFRRM